MRIYKGIYDRLLASPAAPPESGGILGRKNGVVCALYIDCTEQSKLRAEYCPNVERLNTVISAWAEEDICFAGFFHTHLPTQATLSHEDNCYIEEIIRSLPDSAGELYFPVVLPGIAVFSYRAYREMGNIVISEDKITLEKEPL